MTELYEYRQTVSVENCFERYRELKREYELGEISADTWAHRYIHLSEFVRRACRNIAFALGFAGAAEAARLAEAARPPEPFHPRPLAPQKGDAPPHVHVPDVSVWGFCIQRLSVEVAFNATLSAFELRTLSTVRMRGEDKLCHLYGVEFVDLDKAERDPNMLARAARRAAERAVLSELGEWFLVDGKPLRDEVA